MPIIFFLKGYLTYCPPCMKPRSPSTSTVYIYIKYSTPTWSSVVVGGVARSGGGGGGRQAGVAATTLAAVEGERERLSMWREWRLERGW